MGLDDFKQDSSEGNNSSDSGDDSSTDNNNDSSDSSDDAGGLESFKTNTNRGGSGDKNNASKDDSKIFGIEAHKLSQMSEKERVMAIRENHTPDYKPQVQLDERWTFKNVVEIQCVCGNVFHFVTTGLCLSCGRSYKDVGRTVVKLNEPEDKKIHNNDSN